MIQNNKSKLLRERIYLDDICRARLMTIQRIHNYSTIEMANLCSINSIDYAELVNNDPVWLLDKICSRLNLPTDHILEPSGEHMLSYYLSSDFRSSVSDEELQLLILFRSLTDNKQHALISFLNQLIS